MLLIRWFFQSFWIGICAVAMLWQTRLLMSDALSSGWLVGFVFGGTVFGYNFAASPARRWPAWGLGLAGAACFLKLPGVQQALALAPALIWWLYYDRRRVGRFGLRQFPAIKPFAIALAWTWVTVSLPLPPTYWMGAMAIFVGRAAFIFALALAYDLCDQAYDRRHGLVTMVLQLGPRESLRLIDAALVLAAVCVFLNAGLGLYPWQVVLSMLFSLFITRQSIRYLAPRWPWGDWRKVGIDGLMVLQLVLVWGAELLKI